MFAKPNEIGSAESLTTEIENVAGSLRLNVALPFEARRYEFSLPAGEETLDGSNEDEVPVLRRVIDTHTGEVIRTTSLPTVIKEVLIARFGGVRNGSEWFSARATLSASNGATDEEVRNAIEEFEASEETAPNGHPEPEIWETANETDRRIMTDGGREFNPRRCPNDEESLLRRNDDPLKSFCPECGYESMTNLRGERIKVCHKKARIGSVNRSGEAFEAEIEIGGVVQHIVLARRYVRERIDGEEEPEVMTDGGEDEEPPRWRDWSNVKEEKENRLMTDGGSRVHPNDEGVEILGSGNDDDSDIIDAGDDGVIMTDGGEDELPDLSGLEEDNEVRLFYLSQRSGNEVKREGTVSSVIEDDEKRIVRVHAGNPEPLKHKFVSVMEATTESGREGVFAWSQTATAEMPFDGAPKVGKPYSVKFEFSRTSILGEVDRIVRTDRSTPIMMTDGGRRQPSRREPYTVECKEEGCSFAAGPLEFGKVNRKEAEHYIETADDDGSNGHRLRVRQHMPDSARDSGQYEPAEYEHRVVVCFDCGSIIQHFHKEPEKDYSIDTQADRHRENHLEHYRNPPEGASGEPVREPSEHTVIILDASNDRPTVDER